LRPDIRERARTELFVRDMANDGLDPSARFD
jgi:hypothetical protein